MITCCQHRPECRTLGAMGPAGGSSVSVFGVAMDGVIAGRMPEGVLGYYDHSTGCIHVDERLNRLDRHVTVVHERFHKSLKHAPTDTPGVPVARELLVESLTAEYLIPFRQLLDAWSSFSDVAGMARFLNVDPELIYARVLSLSSLERVLLQVCAMRCVGIDMSAPHPEGVLKT